MAAEQADPWLIGDDSDGAKTKNTFLECLRLIERLHRRLLDVLRVHLEEAGKTDLNSVQALLLYNIGDSEMTAGELRTRGYYLGSNVSYNLKKLVDQGYVSHERAAHDKRAVRVALTGKGREIALLVDGLYAAQLQEILGDEVLSSDDLKDMRKHLRNLERYWADQLQFV